MYKKLVFSIALCLGLSFITYAQCEVCEENKDALTFCYQNNNFNEYCATFTDGAPTFLLSKGKKSKTIDLTSKATLKDLIAISEDKKAKISATDILFIQEALKVWRLESWNLGHIYTKSGLGIKTLVRGSGALPKKGQRVKVHYSGFLENGEKFDSSVDRNEPFEFNLGKGEVIKAWDEALQKLTIGSKALIKVPSKLGYGRRGAGRGLIPPNATLFFEIEVLGAK